ncbi:MAG: fluoride efflux transporter FluC [Dermatophilaceae bacterium]
MLGSGWCGAGRPDAASPHPSWRPGQVRPDAATLAAVALGGGAGSLGRWAVGATLPAASVGFPWATVCVNVSGAFSMGLLTAYLALRRRTHRLIQPFVGVGLLGGWTTFSALAMDTVVLVSAGRGSVALASVAATFALGVLAVPVGMWVGRRASPSGHEPE